MMAQCPVGVMLPPATASYQGTVSRSCQSDNGTMAPISTGHRSGLVSPSSSGAGGAALPFIERDSTGCRSRYSGLSAGSLAERFGPAPEFGQFSLTMAGANTPNRVTISLAKQSGSLAMLSGGGWDGTPPERGVRPFQSVTGGYSSQIMTPGQPPGNPGRSGHVNQEVQDRKL